MATSAEIKSNNNTLIRLKTAPKSITKVVVADQMDAIVDYVDQQDALKADKLTKTQGNVDAVSGSKATLQYDINTIDKISSSDLKLPTTTEIGKEVLVLASSYNTFINIYANDAQESKLQGGTNGVTGTQSSLQIYEREAYRFIYKGDGFWYFEKIIDIPTNLYQEKSERTTDGTLATNSNFKYPTEQAVKTYVDSKRPYKSYIGLITQVGTSNPSAIIQLENTFASSIVWTRTAIGRYTGTLNGVFTNMKTWCLITPISGFVGCSLRMQDVDTVEIMTWNTISGSLTDGYLNQTSIEIRVYN